MAGPPAPGDGGILSRRSADSEDAARPDRGATFNARGPPGSSTRGSPARPEFGALLGVPRPTALFLGMARLRPTPAISPVRTYYFEIVVFYSCKKYLIHPIG